MRVSTFQQSVGFVIAILICFAAAGIGGLLWIGFPTSVTTYEVAVSATLH